MTAAAEHDEVVSTGRHVIQQLGFRDVAHPGADLAIEMDIHDRVTNPRGALQGGLLATLVDVVAGRAVLDDGPRETVATADMTIHYLRGVTVWPRAGHGQGRPAGSHPRRGVRRGHRRRDRRPLRRRHGRVLRLARPRPGRTARRVPPVTRLPGEEAPVSRGPGRPTGAAT